jgi:hypothetical protein
MVYNTQNYWAFGLCPPSSITETRKHNVSETSSVSFLRWGGWQDTYSVEFPPPFSWGRKQIQFPKRCVFYFLEYRTMDKVQKPSNSEHKLSSKRWKLSVVFCVMASCRLVRDYERFRGICCEVLTTRLHRSLTLVATVRASIRRLMLFIQSAGLLMGQIIGTLFRESLIAVIQALLFYLYFYTSDFIQK